MNEADLDVGFIPGSELVTVGLKDLRASRISESALLVLIASPNLARHGIEVPVPTTVRPPYEHRLYELLCEKHDPSAYSKYNSLLRRLVSFERALALLNRIDHI